jgi:hypothetical protein
LHEVIRVSRVPVVCFSIVSVWPQCGSSALTQRRRVSCIASIVHHTTTSYWEALNVGKGTVDHSKSVSELCANECRLM